jgi:hypothetical protein
VGTAVALQAPVLVVGDEHFADHVTGLCGGGALVADPCTSRWGSKAASGCTNGEIARTPVVSPHTVDSHLRHIYAKLGISSRIALTRVVLAQGTARVRLRR